HFERPPPARQDRVPLQLLLRISKDRTHVIDAGVESPLLHCAPRNAILTIPRYQNLEKTREKKPFACSPQRAAQGGRRPTGGTAATSGGTAAKSGGTAAKSGGTAAKSGGTAAKSGGTAAKSGGTAAKS